MPHIHEKIDLTCTVYIVYKDKLLLRMHDKYKIWNGVGGHVELDEDPIQAAIRETREEVGLDVVLVGGPVKEGIGGGGFQFKELPAPKFMNIHNVSPTHQHLDLIYFATSTTDVVKLERPSDVCKWVEKEELKTMNLEPNVRYYAEKALEILAK